MTPSQLAVVRKLVEALEMAWRDILDWEATAKGLREMSAKDLKVTIVGTIRGEKESEKVRHKINKAIHAAKAEFPDE